jgi:transposase
VRRKPSAGLDTLRRYAYKLNAELDGLMRIAPIHAAGKKFHNVIKGCRRYLFVFLADRAIPPTNNCSEQALRPCVTFRKVTNFSAAPGPCFSPWAGAGEIRPT